MPYWPSNLRFGSLMIVDHISPGEEYNDKPLMIVLREASNLLTSSVMLLMPDEIRNCYSI